MPTPPIHSRTWNPTRGQPIIFAVGGKDTIHSSDHSLTAQKDFQGHFESSCLPSDGCVVTQDGSVEEVQS